MQRFLGIDIGTTSLKAAVFDEQGNRLALERMDYTLDTDPATGFIEFDAEQYVVMCKEAIAKLQATCGEITALSVDTQGETLILADEHGAPLCPAIVWMDNRAVAVADEIKAAFGNQRVYEVTGGTRPDCGNHRRRRDRREPDQRNDRHHYGHLRDERRNGRRLTQAASCRAICTPSTASFACCCGRPPRGWH